jgi:hypothetical protein
MCLRSVHRPNCTKEKEYDICLCGPQCARHEDCCRPHLLPEEQRLGASPVTCKTLFHTTTYVMTRCPPAWNEPNTRNRCEHPDTNYSDPLFDAPVTSRSTNITYRNWHCASCNRDLDANDTVIWDAAFLCYGIPTRYEILEDTLSYNTSTLQWNSNMDGFTFQCYLRFLPPEKELKHQMESVSDVSIPDTVHIRVCSEYTIYSFCIRTYFLCRDVLQSLAASTADFHFQSSFAGRVRSQ